MPSLLRDTRGFRLPRHGLTLDECEDAWACNNPARRIAVADGASESIYAGEWARYLCAAYVSDPSDNDFTDLTVTALATGGCAGWSVCIYNPDLDPGRDGADAIISYITQAITVSDQPAR